MAISLFSAQADDVTIKATVSATAKNSRTMGECKKQASKDAVKKYLARLDSNMQESVVEKVVKDYRKWVDEVEGDDYEFEDGELTGEFTVSIKKEDLLQFLSGEGWTLSGGSDADGDALKLEVVIAEQKPDAGMMRFAERMGTGNGGKAEFFARYENFQRNVVEALGKQVKEIGITPVPLEFNPAYADMKKADPVVVGGCFSVDNNEWQYTPNFIETIKDNNPDTVVLYYRIDGISFDDANREIFVKVSLSYLVLGGNSGTAQTPIGSKDATLRTYKKDLIGITTEMGTAVARATTALISGADLNKKLQREIKKLRTQANGPKGPIDVVINASKIDAKIRKRAKFMIKKQLLAAGLTTEKDCKVTENTMKFRITKEGLEDPDEAWVEILEVLEKAGIEDVTDDQMTLQGSTMTVTPGK